MKWCCTSLVIREMQIIMTVRFHTTHLAEWPKSRRLKIPGKEMVQLELPYITAGQYITGTTVMENC